MSLGKSHVARTQAKPWTDPVKLGKERPSGFRFLPAILRLAGQGVPGECLRLCLLSL